MSAIEYLPVVLAGAGIALRFWMSREATHTTAAPVVCAAPSTPAFTPARAADKAVSQHPELALA